MKAAQYILFLTFFTATGFVSTAQEETYQKQLFIKNGDTLPYRLLLPKNYDAAMKYPLLLFLHGAGERGSNNEAQLVHGSKLFLNDSIRDNFPAIVVFPQCAANSYWSNVTVRTDSVTRRRKFEFAAGGPPTKSMELLLGLLNHLEDKYKQDSKRRYVGGLSMGGMGTFELVRRKPKYFAAAFPICGGANPETAKKLKRTKWWVFHGAKDDVVPPGSSAVIVDALNKIGADVKFTLYANANHNSWDAAFAEKDLLPWLFSQRK